MGEAILAGLWNAIVFFANFLVKVVIVAGAKALFHGAGLIVLGVLIVLAIGVVVVARIRQTKAR